MDPLMFDQGASMRTATRPHVGSVAVGEETERAEPGHPGLGHLGQQVRELGEGRIAVRQTRERPLDPQGHVFEPVEREAGEGLARCAARFPVFAPEHVDQQIDDARPFELPEKLGEAGQTKGGLVFFVEVERLAHRALQDREHPRGFSLREIVVRVARCTLCVVESPESGDRIET